MGGFQPLPGLGTLGLLPGQFGFTEAVFHGLQRNLHFVANIQGAFTVGIGKLVQGYHALRLQTGVNSHPLVINIDNHTGHDRAGFHVDGFQTFFKKLSEGFAHEIFLCLRRHGAACSNLQIRLGLPIFAVSVESGL